MFGYFISFEGGEGAGKSTQISYLKDFLIQQGYRVLVTRQPGGTAYGQRIRELILAPNTHENLSARAELFLYLADRAHHVDTVIRPALEQGQIVICDRYADSTLAYQGYGRQLDLAELKTLNHLATSGLQPTLTIWLDIEPMAGRERILGRNALDRLEQESMDFHQRVRDGYLDLSRQEPRRWRQLDACQSEEAIQLQIQTLVTGYLQA